MRSLTPMPSGYVRPRRATLSLAQLPGPARVTVGTFAGLCGEALRLGLRLTREIIRRHERARLEHTLTRLSDHALKDIGLERSGIPSAVMDIERGIDPRR
ncbi:MAG: DUF1127 domain-containing protein [Kiloniellales bacterium]